jgi:cation diffusion facilitator family transporter
MPTDYPQAHGAPIASSLRAGVVSLVVGSSILALKLLAWLLTGSTALLADAAESVVNVFAAAILTYSLSVSARPPDANHPYGHGKAEALSALVEGALVMIAGLGIVAEAIRRIYLGPELQNLGLGIAVSAVAGLANLALGAYLLAQGRRHRSEALHADGVHVLTDTVTTAAGIAALLVVAGTGWPLLDPLVGLAVAGNVLWAGWRVIRRSLTGLLDEADFDLLVQLGEEFERHRVPEWCEIHQLRAWAAGSTQHVDLHLVVPRYLSLDAAHGVADHLEQVILSRIHEDGDAVIHIDPCRPVHCPRCTVDPCPVRSSPLEKPASFEVRSLTRPGVV